MIDRSHILQDGPYRGKTIAEAEFMRHDGTSFHQWASWYLSHICQVEAWRNCDTVRPDRNILARYLIETLVYDGIRYEKSAYDCSPYREWAS